ncbi:MAG: RNA methyltransferase, partial [Nitrososphaerota archaeon]
YWGYQVKEAPSLTKLLKSLSSSFIILTAKEGEEVQKVWDRLLSGIKEAQSILVVFGSPRRGLFEILSDEKEEPKNFSEFVINTIPGQKTETVRTEEALLATLVIINLMARL